MKKGLILAAGFMMISTPALAETTAWGGVSAGLNIDGGSVSAMARVGADTTIGNGAFMGIALGIGESGVKECQGAACAIGGRELTAEARLGGVTRGGTKFYAIGGYSNLKLTGKYGALNIISGTDGGVTGGVGVQLPLGSKSFIRSEFRYSDYGGASVTSIMPTIGFNF